MTSDTDRHGARGRPARTGRDSRVDLDGITGDRRPRGVEGRESRIGTFRVRHDNHARARWQLGYGLGVVDLTVGNEDEGSTGSQRPLNGGAHAGAYIRRHIGAAGPPESNRPSGIPSPRQYRLHRARPFDMPRCRRRGASFSTRRAPRTVGSEGSDQLVRRATDPRDRLWQ